MQLLGVHVYWTKSGKKRSFSKQRRKASRACPHSHKLLWGLSVHHTKFSCKRVGSYLSVNFGHQSSAKSTASLQNLLLWVNVGHASDVQ